MTEPQNEAMPNHLLVYISGRFPSALELSGLLCLIETALAWSAVAPLIARSNAAYSRYQAAHGTEERSKTHREYEKTRRAWNDIRESYDRFLADRVASTIDSATSIAYSAAQRGAARERTHSNVSDILQSVGHLTHQPSTESGTDQPRAPFAAKWNSKLSSMEFRHLFQLLEHELMDGGRDTLEDVRRRVQQRLVNERGLGQPGCLFEDFAAWRVQVGGTRQLQTLAVDPSGSISFVFDITALFASLLLQDAPVVKDVVMYMAGALRSWNVGRSDQQGAPLPILAKDLGKIIGSFDEVDLAIVQENGVTRYDLRLRRCRGSSSD